MRRSPGRSGRILRLAGFGLLTLVAVGVMISTVYMARAEQRRQRDVQMAIQANK